MRNHLSHRYFDADHEIVTATIEHDPPPLIAPVCQWNAWGRREGVTTGGVVRERLDTASSSSEEEPLRRSWWGQGMSPPSDTHQWDMSQSHSPGAKTEPVERELRAVSHLKQNCDEVARG